MPIVTSFRYIILYTNPTYCATSVVLTVRRLSSLLYDNCRPYCTTTVVLTVRQLSPLLCDNYRPYCATTVVLTVRRLSSLLCDNYSTYSTIFFYYKYKFFRKNDTSTFFFIIFAIEISNDNILYSIITASKEVL